MAHIGDEDNEIKGVGIYMMIGVGESIRFNVLKSSFFTRQTPFIPTYLKKIIYLNTNAKGEHLYHKPQLGSHPKFQYETFDVYESLKIPKMFTISLTPFDISVFWGKYQQRA